MPPIVCLIATGKQAFEECKVFLQMLTIWHPDAQVYILTDTPTKPLFDSLKTSATMNVYVSLNKYVGMNRRQMEKLPSDTYSSLWMEYMYEKAEVLKWAFDENPNACHQGVWFNDSDIIHLAPLPSVPEGKTCALCPHNIKKADEAKYGRYNGGYFWIRDPALIDVWIEAAPKTRYFEQATLEDMGKAAGSQLYEFPDQVDFGWWRMFQNEASVATIQSRFSIRTEGKCTGVYYDLMPLQSIHTHFDDNGASTNGKFNAFLNNLTAKYISHGPIAAFRKAMRF